MNEQNEMQCQMDMCKGMSNKQQNKAQLMVTERKLQAVFVDLCREFKRI